MSTQEEARYRIASSIAKALDLHAQAWPPEHQDADGYVLHLDGSNIGDPHWFKRCLDFLVDNGWVVQFDTPPLAYPKLGGFTFHSYCDRSEFPARAIHELMRRREQQPA